VFLQELLMHRGDCSFCTKLLEASLYREGEGMRFPIGELNEDFNLLVHSLKKIGPLPPIQQIAPDAFDHSGYKIDPALWKDAGPLAIDLSIFPYHGNKDKLRLCDEIRAHLRGESPEEQLLHYEFDYQTNGTDGLETHSHAQVNYMALSRILLDEEGFLLAISYGTEDRDWIYLTRTDWVTVGWRSKMEDTYPYYEKYVVAALLSAECSCS
jgi:hypothetical protein